MKKRKWPKVVALVLVLAAAAALLLPKMLGGQQNTVLSANMIEHTVSRGDLSVTVTGSGRLETADVLAVELPVGVKIDEIFVEQGDIVEEGDFLAAIDVDSASDRAAQLSAELGTLDMQLMMRRTVGQISAPVKGRVKQISAAEDGDVIETINRCGSLAVLSTDGLMQIEIDTDSELAMNAEVDVKWNGGSEEGTVAGKTEGGYLITFSDEDAPYLAEADVYYNVEKIGTGVMEIHAPLTVLGNGGTIEQIHKEVDDQINAGAKLFTLSNEPAVDSYRQTLASRNEKAEQFQAVLALIDEPCICAPEDGIVQGIFVQEDEKTASADMAGNMKAFELGIGGAVQMTVNIDELDIAKIKVGQEVAVTLDAITGESFAASVSRISYIGQNTGSITTYAAQITLEADERLLPGMNGSAVICAETAENALLVPLSAVSEDEEGEFVNVAGAEGEHRIVRIETGLSDGTNAQVLSGLNEGDVIVYRGSMNAFLLMQQKMMENQAAMFGGVQE